MDLVGNDVDILYEEIKYLVDHLVGNDVDTLHEERIHLVGFNFIGVIDIKMTYIKIKLPLNFAIRGVPKRVCVWQETNRDAYDRIYHKE